MILHTINLENIILKLIIQSSFKNIFIKYNKKDELKVLSNMANIDNGFIILQVDSIINLNIINSYVFEFIDEKNYINNIISDDNIKLINQITLHESCNYVYFLCVDNKIMSDSYIINQHNVFLNCIYKIQLDKIKKNFSICDLYFYNSHAIVIYTNNIIDEKITKNSISIYTDNNLIENKKIILDLLMGIGDFFMDFSIEYEFLNQYKYHDYNKYIFVLQDYYKHKTLVSLFFNDCEFLMFNNYVQWFECMKYVFSNDLFKLSYYSDIFAFKEKYNQNNIHICDLICETLNVKKDINLYKYNDAFISKFYKLLDKSEVAYIDGIINDDIIIGLQTFTGSLIYGDIWVSDIKRNWDIDEVKNFIELCSNNNIKILLLDQHLLIDLPNCKKIKNISLPAYIYAISKVSLMVGIDSSAGHIASFFNIPNITVWNATHPCTGNNEINISFRPLRKNISFYTDRQNFNIPASIVFEEVKKIINHEIIIDDKITKI